MEGLEFINAMFAGDELSFASGMEHHRREVDEYMWAEGGEGEKPDKSVHNDHAMDAMLYALMGHLVKDGTYQARSW